ncbi:TCR VDJ BV7 BJ7 [Pelobates cultripes]|nr:TCR VDJ BV7 BJ7 [Pelobates cultripes]
MWTIFSLYAILTFLPCLCLGVKVEQDPKLIIVPAGKPAEFQCKHDDSSYIAMFWYQQRPGQGLKLMIHSTSEDAKSDAMEDEFKSWAWNRTRRLEFSLKLPKSQTSDSAVYFCAASFCLGVKVEQGSKLIIVEVGKPVELQCKHDDNSMFAMYWYQQRPGEALKLMIYSTEENAKTDAMEDEFKSWAWNRPSRLNSTLTLSSSLMADSAVYFCAVSQHSHKFLSNTEHKTCSFIQHH